MNYSKAPAGEGSSDLRVGITTTVPIEPVIAAGFVPVDLNNLFISSPDPVGLIARAEREGFPRNCCSWIKGMYGAILEYDIKRVIEVSRGDCDAGRSLCEVVAGRGVETLPFSYPESPDAAELDRSIERLCASLATTRQAAERVFEDLRETRCAVLEAETACHWSDRVSASELQSLLVSSSDFNGDPSAHRDAARALLGRAAGKNPSSRGEVRLGLIGVPPIIDGLYDYVEGLGARVVYHEVSRQFALPAVREGAGLTEAYARYTYPYGITNRLRDARGQLAERKADGVIHYVQTFCHRQIEDIVVKEALPLPVLTLEGDRPAAVEARSKLRLEAFVSGVRRTTAS